MRPDLAKRIIIKMLAYLDGHIGIDELIQEEDVERGIRVSKARMNRACRLVLGVNAYHLIYHIKMHKAYYLSNVKEINELEIARILGYSDASSLCHAFNNLTDKTLKTCTKEDLETPLQIILDELIKIIDIKEFFTKQDSNQAPPKL